MNYLFIEQARRGKNDWWRYVLTFLITVAGIAVINLGIQQLLPTLKALVPDNQFGKDLLMSILVAVVFTVAILGFSAGLTQLHQRPFFSCINLLSRFRWKQYFGGFLVWGALVFFGSLLTGYDAFQAFSDRLVPTHLLILFVVGFFSIGIQSFFEEIFIRGYLLQGLHLRIKNIIVLIAVNSLIFGIMHFGYGIGSLIHSFTFAVAFTVIVLLHNGIEFASGAHNANNLVLSLFFLDLSEATSAAFSWSIDWMDLVLHLVCITLLVGIAYRFSGQREQVKLSPSPT